MDNILNNTRSFAFSKGEKLKGHFPWLPGTVYYIALFLYLFSQFTQGVLGIHKYFPWYSSYRLEMVAAIVFVLKIIVFDSHQIRDWFILLLLGIILSQSGMNADDLGILYYYLAIIGAKDVDFRNILRLFLVTVSAMLVLTIALAKLKILPGLVFNRGDGALRYALGTIYPSDLAARCFYLMIAYALLRNYKLKLPEYIGLFSITIWAYVITDTKVDFILMVLFLLVAVFHEQSVMIMEKLTHIGIAVILGLSTAFMIIMTYLYNPANHFMKVIDHILSGRFYFSHIAFEKYNVTVLGQYIPQNGFGGSNGKVFDYFYIDCSYIRVLMMFGAFVFLLLVAYLLYLSHRFMTSEMYALEITLILVALSSLIDQHMWEISYNILFLATFADLKGFKKPEYNLSFS